MIPVTLQGDDPTIKRQEILNYFNNSYETFEKLFDMLKDESVFYKKSEPTRHPMIFYFGHTATFYINKLILAKIITKRINPSFESLFAIGVDEMSWDDLDQSKYNWPSVNEVKAYRVKVKKIIQDLIKTLPLKLPITQKDPFWIILMGIEHERIHLETSSVLHRQMPLEFIKKTDHFTICKEDNFPVKNELIKICSKDLRLGKNKEHHLYGWDNEYGKYETTIEQFEVSKYLVSNNEFLEFVQDKGYENEKFWDDEGKNFLKRTKAKHPVFWISQKDGNYLYRHITQVTKLPLSWPVEVNCLEAQAFLKWKSLKDNISYTLPSEEQYYSIYEEAKLEDIPKLQLKKFNINLEHFTSAAPVDKFCSNGIYDPIGNVWQWTRTPIYPFDGFEVHPIYDDFSVPTFDNKHNLIKGGSFISTGNEIMKHSRYAFRRHFFQHAGFKYIKGDEKLDAKSFFTKDDLIEKLTIEHIKTDKITKTYQKLLKLIDQYHFNNIFEIGCGLAAGSIELSKTYQNITAVDTTARIIQEAKHNLKGYKDITNIQFWQVDPCNIKPYFKDYDLIIVNDIISRIYSPLSLIQNVKNRLLADGILITITSNEDEISSFNKVFTIKKQSSCHDKKITIWKQTNV